MLQFSEPQDSKRIRDLIAKFRLLELGENIKFSESNFIEIIEYFINKNRPKKAFSVLAKAITFFPESYDLKLSEAQLLIESGLHNAASKKLRFLYKQNPEDIGLMMLLGINYTKLAIINKAKYFFDKALGMINDNKDSLLFSISQTFISAGRFDVATQYLKKAYEISPEDEAIILDLAFCYDRIQNYTESEKLYNYYVIKNPFSKLAWYNYGVVLSELNKNDLSIQAFDFAIALDENFSSPVYNKAHVYFQMKEYEQAIEQFDIFLEIENSNPSALYYKALCYFFLNNFKQALKNIKLSLKLQPKSAESWFAMSEIYFRLNNFTKAKKSLYFAIEIDRLNSKYWKLSADIFIKEQNFKFADKSFLHALSFDPFVDDYWFAYSDLKTLQKDYKEAISILNTAKEFISDSATYLLKMSSLYLLNGDKANAIECFENAKNICSDAISKIKQIHPDKKQISFFN